MKRAYSGDIVRKLEDAHAVGGYREYNGVCSIHWREIQPSSWADSASFLVSEVYPGKRVTFEGAVDNTSREPNIFILIVMSPFRIA